jgi:hypothetical protein
VHSHSQLVATQLLSQPSDLEDFFVYTSPPSMKSHIGSLQTQLEKENEEKEMLRMEEIEKAKNRKSIEQ